MLDALRETADRATPLETPRRQDMPVIVRGIRRASENHRYRLECLVSGHGAGTDARMSVW